MDTPTKWEIWAALALFEELLENFSPVDQDDIDHMEAARKVLKWEMTVMEAEHV